MGREISYICDACGRDCTHHYFIVSLTRKIGDETHRGQVKGDDPILCPDCVVPVQSFLSRLEGMEWELDDEDDGF